MRHRIEQPRQVGWHTAVLIALVAACTGSGDSGLAAGSQPSFDVAVSPTARIVLVGDVMLGRGVASTVDTDPDSVFEGVRHLIASSDLAGANLESPLTTRAHVSRNENHLEADPASVSVLSDAGFDLMSIANNHTFDAGEAGLLDTIDALDVVGITPIGGGRDDRAAWAPVIRSVRGLDVGFLAFDATGAGHTAREGPGVATWDPDRATAAIARLRRSVDIVVVSIQGGTEYLPVSDPLMTEIGDVLVDAGVDVMWGHGAHVTQPVDVLSGGRPTIISTSLGNFLFDQVGPERTSGYLLDLLVDEGGVVAHRVGLTTHADRRVRFETWLDPEGDAVFFDGTWWSLDRPVDPSLPPSPDLDEFPWGDLVVASVGDVDADGDDELVASFRRPFRSTPFMELHPEHQWQDDAGRSAHVGVYEPDTLEEVWVAGTVMMPVAGLAVCDGSVALVHDQLDDTNVVEGGAWTWNGFGFDTAATLDGSARPACSDVDGDGTTEPVLVERSGTTR